MLKTIKISLFTLVFYSFLSSGMDFSEIWELNEISEKNKEQRDRLTEQLLQNFSLEKISVSDLKSCLSKNISIEKDILEKITEKSVTELSDDVLDFLVSYNSEIKKKIREIFCKIYLGSRNALEIYLEDGNQGKELLLRKWKYSKTKPDIVNTSTSVGHFYRLFYENKFFWYDLWGSYFLEQYTKLTLRDRKIPSDSNRLLYLKAIRQQAIETTTNKKFVAFHAQSSRCPGLHMNFIFMHLLELYYKKEINKEEWWALRFALPGTMLPYADAEEIIKKGPKTGNRGDTIYYKHFMNGSLFGNTTWNVGSDTVGFFERNRNVNVGVTLHQSIEKLFDIFGWGKYYLQYKDSFDTIEELYSKKTGVLNFKSGILLMHIFDEQAWKNFVYFAKPFGFKQSIKINGEKIDDAVKIYRAMRDDPESVDFEQLDRNELVFIQTNDHPTDQAKLGSLNPFHPGIKTLHYTVEDYSDVKKMIKDVFMLIKQDMQKDDEEVQNKMLHSNL